MPTFTRIFVFSLSVLFFSQHIRFYGVFSLKMDLKLFLVTLKGQLK